MYRSVGQKLKAVRHSNGVTQEQVAYQSFCAENTIWKIENGRMSPTIAMLQAICKGLGISISDFFSDVQLES